MDKLEKEMVKEKIRIFEQHAHGLDKIAGVNIDVRNLKERELLYIADIIISEDKFYSDRYNNCKYLKEIVNKGD